jgi:hypothetical protein
MIAVKNEVFLEAMFEDTQPGTHTIVCSFPGNPYTVDRPSWAGRSWMPRMKLPGRFERENSYLTVSAFEPDAESGGRYRRKANFAALFGVMVDDIGTKVQATKLMLPPSALIETSPKNYQAYYFIVQDATARDRPVCERLIERMIAAGLTADGADPGMRGVTRYGRLPGGVNAKPKYIAQLGRPFAVRCETFEPMRRYAIAEIAAAWRLDLSPPAAQRINVVSITPALLERAGFRFEAMLEVFRMMKMYLGRRGTWHDVVCPWIHTHTDRCTSGTALAEPSADNNYAAGFVCHHGHCNGSDQKPRKTMSHVRAWLRQLSSEMLQQVETGKR